jgi:hypothetical protein
MLLIAFNWDLDLGFILGLLGFAGSMWAVLRTLKLEKQQYTLNKYAIEEKEKEREEAKHAKLKVFGTSEDLRCLMKMRIANDGKCDADDVTLTIMNKSLQEYPEGLSFDRNIPSHLGAGDGFDFALNCWTGEDVLELKITWTDDSGPYQSVKSIQIKCQHD